MPNKQAEILNEVIKNNNITVFNLLSEKGREIYYPKDGILAQSAEAKGKKINATIGIALEEDGSPMRLSSIADNIPLPPAEVFPYAPSFGNQDLRQLWKKMIYQKNPSLKNEISLPVATQALTHGLSLVGYLFVNAGDEIILPDKFWGNYRLVFERGFGAKLVTHNTFFGSGFDLEDFRQKLSGRVGKKIVLLNFPNNPAGYSPTETEADAITQILKERAEAGDEVLAICDDAYFGLVYEQGVIHESIFARLNNLHKNLVAVKIDGPTKENYVWGLRVGFITFGYQNMSVEAGEALAAKTAGAIRGEISNISNLSQSLVLRGLTAPQYVTEKQEKFEILQKRYDAIKKCLADKEHELYFRALPFNSGYFMCVELVAGIEAEKIRQILLQKYDTGVIAMGNLLRIAFSSVKIDDIPVLFANIISACKEVKK